MAKETAEKGSGLGETFKDKFGNDETWKLRLYDAFRNYGIIESTFTGMIEVHVGATEVNGKERKLVAKLKCHPQLR